MEAMRLRLLLVRHGESSGNTRGCFVGRSASPLTTHGVAQAEAMARHLANWDIHACWCSPLARAHNTAQIICRDRALEAMIDERLAEQDYGDWDGVPFAEVRQRFAKDFQRWAAGGTKYPPTNGEPLPQVAKRVIGWFNDVLSQLSHGQTVLVVAHAGVLQALLCHLLDTKLNNRWPFRLATGSLAEVSVFENRAVLHRLSHQPILA